MLSRLPFGFVLWAFPGPQIDNKIKGPQTDNKIMYPDEQEMRESLFACGQDLEYRHSE